MPLLARGLWFRGHRAVRGGARLMLGRRVRLNASPAGTRLELGPRVRLYHDVGIYLDAPAASVRIGGESYVNRRSEICAKDRVEIGARCAISWDVTISDTDYHVIEGSAHTERVRLGDDVWVGTGAKILKGVTIGDGAVIAAGAVVVEDVPARTLVAGVPARVIREEVAWRPTP